MRGAARVEAGGGRACPLPRHRRGLAPGEEGRGGGQVREGAALEERSWEPGHLGEARGVERRRRPKPVAGLGEGAEQRGGGGRGGQGAMVDRRSSRAGPAGRDEGGELLLGVQVAEDAAKWGGQILQSWLSSSRRMNSASSPAASRPWR